MANDETTTVQDAENSEQSSGEQSNASDQSEMQSQKLFDVNGQQFTADQLAESYKNLQKDYTKKSNELAQLKKPQEESTDSPDDEVVKAKEALRQLGVVTKEDLEATFKERETVAQQQRELEELLSTNPHLSPYREAIVAIGKTDNRSYYDIAASYNFAAKDKLQRAKQSEPVGAMPQKVKAQQKSIKDLSPDEYESWRKDNLKGSRFFT